MTNQIIAANEGYLVSDTLRGRHGYLYGLCARQLHYASKTKEVVRTETSKKSIEWGVKMHWLSESMLQQKFLEWNLKTEQNFTRKLPQPIYGVKQVQVTADLEGANKVIEIKPKYSIRAYIQTLVQKYVLPNHDFFMYAYSKKDFFPIKADLKMATVYLGRILTSIKYIPPRVPGANPECSPCLECQFRIQCWREQEGSWATFKEQSEYAINKLRPPLSTRT